MDALLAVLVLVVLGILGARFGFRDREAPLGVRLFLSTGTHFLVLGFLLGPHGAGLFDPELLDAFSPVVALGLGWIGFLFGMQFDRESLRAFTLRERAASMGQALVAFLVLSAAGVGGYLWLGGSGTAELSLILAAAAVGCITTPTGLGVVFGSVRASGPASRLLSLSTSLDAAVGITALAGVLAWFHPPTVLAGVPLAPVRWFVATLLLGIFFGWLFLSLTREGTGAEELVLFLLGLTLLAAGTGAYFSLSPLFACAAAGAFVANFTPFRNQAYSVLSEWEKPVYVVFLLLGGALLRFPGWILLPLVAAYVLLRIVAKLAGGLVALPALPADSREPLFGLGLTAQGGISLAMAVSVYHVIAHAYPGLEGVDHFFSVVVLGVMVSELVGPPLVRTALVRAGEVTSR